MRAFLVVLILISLFALVIYAYGIRPFLVNRNYKLGKNLISLKEKVSQNELLDILKKHLTYPSLKGMHYNQAGELSLVGKHGVFDLVIEDLTLQVQATNSFTKRKTALRQEEAICLCNYIEQALYGNSDTNPYNLYKRLKFWNLGKIFFAIGIVVAISITILVYINPAGQIQNSYLSQYSSTITVGEAFESFFGNPKWENYKDGVQEMVDFQGTCLRDDEKVTVKMTFEYYEDSFKLVKTTVDGNETLGILLEDSILEAAYKEASSQ